MGIEANLPKLRFPEFSNNWTENNLSEIAVKKNEKNKNVEIKDVFTNSASLGIINQRDFFDKDIANQNNLTGYFIVDKDDFIYNPRISNSAPVGPISRNKIGLGVMSPLYTVFRFSDKLNFDFIEHFFSTKIWHIHMEDIANYGARADRMSFAIGDFFKMPINIPSHSEQTKIASFLTAVDDKLQALKKKKELLEQYKKGMMQQLFSQEIRFKKDDGTNYPDWEEKKLGEVTYKVDKKNKTKEKLPIYSISNQNGFVPQSEQFEGLDSNERGYDISLYKVVQEETFAYNPARINVGSIGYSGKDKCKVIISSLYICFKTIDIIDDYYFQQFLKTSHFKDSVLRNGEGGVRIYLFFDKFSEISINIPCIHEQTKIANFLSAIDDKIAHCQSELDGLEQWKKGLLQQLFC
jgi:type I restriction enzyme S subunit